jgi:hypothetical protein
MASSLKALLVLHDYDRARKKMGLDGQGEFFHHSTVPRWRLYVDCTGYDDGAARLGFMAVSEGLHACALRARSGVFDSSSSYTRTESLLSSSGEVDFQ